MKKHGMNKKQAEKILATAVMGMNLVNTVAPLAVLAAAEQKLSVVPQPVRSEAEPLDYTILPQLADAVDNLVFAKAYATSYDGTAHVSVMVSGDMQIITANQSGTVDTMLDGTQVISRGGMGTVDTMSSGKQYIYDGGTGIVNTLNDGWLMVQSGGKSIVDIMSGGAQKLNDIGIVSVNTMHGGYQSIASGICTVDIMSGGAQSVGSKGKGTVNTMHGGYQVISGSSAAGTVNTMFGGAQSVGIGGKCTVDIMSGGKQFISYGGIGTVNTMFGGTQLVSSSGTALDTVIAGGTQLVSNGGTALDTVIAGGTQLVSVGAVVNGATLSAGIQQVYDGTNLNNITFADGTQAVMSGAAVSGMQVAAGQQRVENGGTSLDTVLNSGGTVYQKSGGIISGMVYSGGVQIIENITTGYDGMTLGSGGTNVTMGVISGAQMSGTIINSGGEQLVLNGGTALDTELNGGSLQLSSGGIISSLTLTSGSLELENINGGSFTVSGTLTANNATVDMTDSSIKRAVPSVAYETLTIDKLSGSGTTFIMDTDLSGETNSDKVIITHADVGTHYVQIKDLSKLNNIEVTGAHQQLLITDVSGKLTFEGKEFNAGGLWDVDPTLAKGDSLGLSANDWYLTKLEKTVNNDTRVLLDAADNSYALWRNTNDSLRSRLGALASGSEQSDGIWARTQAGRFSGDNYEGRYNLYQLGFDQAADAKSVYGAAVDYGDGNGSYDNGSGKDKLKSFSLYGVWTAANGAYTNVTARYGMVSTDLESYGDYPDKAEYKQHAYSVSVEYGKRFDMERGFFIEPQAQFTLGRLGSINYTTDRGANGYIEGMNSAIGRIGFVMGQKITGGSDIYLKADLLHEFAGERDLRLTSDAGGTSDMLTKHNDYGDTWFELGLGANIKVSKTASIYGEVERGFGGDINKKWSVNGGVRFTF